MTDREVCNTRIVRLVSLPLLSVALVSGCGQASPRSTDPYASTVAHQLQVSSKGLCGSGSDVTITLAEAEGKVPYPLLLPDSSFANAKSLSTLVLCSPTELISVFDSGIRMYTDVSDIADPNENWKQAAADDPNEASFGSIEGQPALLIDPSMDQTKTAKGSVSFVLNKTLVIVEGSGSQSLDDLISVAQTVRQSG